MLKIRLPAAYCLGHFLAHLMCIHTFPMHICMYIYNTHTSLFTYIHTLQIHLYMYKYNSFKSYLNTCIDIYDLCIYMHLHCMYACKNVNSMYAYMYIFLFVYLYICIFVYLYMCIYVCMYIFTFWISMYICIFAVQTHQMHKYAYSYVYILCRLQTRKNMCAIKWTSVDVFMSAICVR